MTYEGFGASMANGVRQINEKTVLLWENKGPKHPVFE